MREGLEPSLSFESKTQERREELIKGSSHLHKKKKKKKNPRVQGYDLWIINFRQIYILHLINLTNCYFSSISLKIVVLVHEI